MSKLSLDPLINKAAIEFLKGKVPELSDHYDSFIAPVHAKSFTIAGGTQLAFLSDMQQALIDNKAKGLSLREFHADFESIKAKYGWSHKGNSMWRARVIYDTNVRSAQMAAKWQQAQLGKAQFPYLEYRIGNSRVHRKDHQSWDGLILPVEHPFWDTHYPPNGYGCKCDAYQIDDFMMEADGLGFRDAPVIERKDVTSSNGNVSHNQPVGVDVGFDSNVGQAWLAPDVALGKKLASLPPTMASAAYQFQTTGSFINAVSNAWFKSFDAIVQKKNQQLFAGYINHDVNQALISKSDDIIAKSVAYNAKQSERYWVKVPTTESLQIENLAIVTPDDKKNHYLGIHRQKGVTDSNAKKVEKAHDWLPDWIMDVPKDIYHSKLVFYDIKEQSIGFLTDHKKLFDGVWRHGVIYVRINQKMRYPTVSNWIVSLNTKPFAELDLGTVKLIDQTKSQP